MIDKIKELLKIKEVIDEIRNDISDIKKELSELKKEVTDVTSSSTIELKEIKEKNKEVVEEINTLSHAMKEFKNTVENEINDLKLLKSQFRNKLVEQLDVSFREELVSYVARLKTDVENFNTLKKEITFISTKISSLTDEMNKFIEISRNIKAGDFELEKFAKRLTETDKEKLELMHKIDALERLISAERRRRS